MVRRAAAAPCRTGSPCRARARGGARPVQNAAGTDWIKRRSSAMTCPSCGSEDVRVQVVTIHQLRNRHHSVLYWVLVGWWLQPLLWICFSIPMLMIRLFAPRTKARRRAQQHGRLPAVRPGLEGQMTARCPVLVCSLFFPEAKREPEKKAINPLAKSRCARPSAELASPAKIFCGFFFFVLFLSVKEKEPKRKLRNPLGSARCARPSAELTFPAKNILRGFSFRKAPQGKMGNG